MTKRSVERDQLEGILNSLESHVAQPQIGGVDRAVRRGRRRKLFHGVGVAVAAVVVLTGVLIPLGLLSELGDSNQAASSPVPSVSQVAPTTPTSPLYGSSSSVPLSFERVSGHRQGWDRFADTVSGVSIEVPDDWSFIQDPEPDISDPRMLFGTGTIDLSDGNSPCQLLSKVATDGAVVLLVEWFEVEKLGGSPSDFPRQPSVFDLKSAYLTGPHDCLEDVPDEYTIPFQASGRYFWFTVAVGSSAPASLRSSVVDVLSSIRVEAAA